MSVAHLETLTEPEEAPQATAGNALKQQAVERLAAHRQRRAAATAGPAERTTPIAQAAPETRSARVAAAVAERYAQQQSYRQFLAAEAERAIQQAEAAAQVAARSAEAITQAQNQLLAELAEWGDAPLDAHTGETAGPALLTPELQAVHTVADVTAAAVAAPEMPVEILLPEAPARAAKVESPAPAAEWNNAGLRVRLYEDVGPPVKVAPAVQHRNEAFEALTPEEMNVLEAEIDYRQSPVFVPPAPAEPIAPIAANVITFPRQLVAQKKARPRLAEGPLREDTDPSGQIRIFEVAAELAPVEAPIAALPEWSSIRLDAQTAPVYAESPDAQLSFAHPPETAPMARRAMASLVDAVVILGSFVGAATVFALVAGTVPRGLDAGIMAGGTLALFAVAYYLLCFTLSDQTPGMRYARIGLCTFSDENPSRAEMRRRLISLVLAAAPLGMGIVWAVMDDDRLGWHDRMSRMYPRAY